jgi:hypothetical protein
MKKLLLTGIAVLLVISTAYAADEAARSNVTVQRMILFASYLK